MTSRKNILIISIALEGYSKIFKHCIESQRQYCSKHGFKYVLIDKAPRKLYPAEAAWLKIFLLRSALNCKYEWVAFIDADCEIRYHAPSFLNDFANYGIGKSIFLAHGFSGRINSGVIFLKNTIEARNYLDKVIKFGDREVPDEDKALYENGHMIYYGKNNPDLAIIDWEKWNNNQNLNPSSYIQHYSGGILREQYLKKMGSGKPKDTILKNFKKKFKIKFSSPESKLTMAKLHLLLPFYLNEYPEFQS